MAFTAVSQTDLSCGEIVVRNPPEKGEFFDRFGNLYSSADLNAFNHPNDIVLEDCNSGIFTLQFGLMGNVPAWTMDEMMTVCSTFNYVSGLISTGSNTNSIFLKITKDEGCLSDGAGSPIWQRECGIVNSIIFDQIVSGINNYPAGFISGLICIRPNPSVGTWHTLNQDCSPTDPCVGIMEADLYSVMLHEALHVVGFSSLIGLDGSSIFGTSYSQWDRLLYSTNQSDYLVKPQSSPTCCDHHLFNEEDFPDMPSDLSGDCSMNVFIFDGLTNVAEVNNDLVVPASNGEMANKLSHLDNSCTQGANFVMNPSILSGTSNRIISLEEQEILCQLGYSGGGCSNPCVIIANNDGPYTLILSQGSSITIAAAELLSNDVLPTNFAVGLCGSPPEISVDFINDIFTISGSQEGVFSFCYNISGCQSWCDEAIVYVIVRQDIVESECIAPNCNLACFGDFEEFIPGYQSFWPQIPLDYFGLGNSLYPNLPSILQEIENGNKVLNVQRYPGGQDAVIIPLNSIVENGCTIDISFDAVSSLLAQSTPSLEFYGLTAYLPSNGNIEPTCQPNPFQFSTGIDAVCIGVVPIIPPDSDAVFDLFTGEASNLDFLPYSVQWVNSSGFSISHILAVPSWIGTNAAERSVIHFDNLIIKNSCLPELSITPTILSQCINEQVEISYEVCIEGSQNVPTLIELHATLPPIPGVTIANTGDFDPNGDVSISLTPLPNGIPICTTLTLFLDVEPNVQPGTQVSISIDETAKNVCLDNNPETLVTLEDCNPIFSCRCTETGQINIDATSGSLLYNPNLEGVLWSDYALANNLPDILDGNVHNGCIAIAGRLIIDRDVEIKSCGEIHMQPCSEIWVGTGQSSTVYPSLLLYLNNLYGCEQMWKGITVQQFCMLTMGKNSIEDAQFAVKALGSNLIHPPVSAPTRFYAVTNFFRNNHIGVYIPTNRKQTVLHAPFHYNNFIGRIPGKPLLPPCDAGLPNYSDQMGYAGLVTLGTAFDVGTSGSNGYVNTFRDIRNGVIGENDAWVNVYRARFDNIPGYMGVFVTPSFAASSGVGVLLKGGISSVKNSRFERVGHGLFSNKAFSITAFQNQMPDVYTGIQAESPRGFEFNENQPIEFRDWGIKALNTIQLSPTGGLFQIKTNNLNSKEADNDILLEAAINVGYSNNTGANEDYRIIGNTITLRDVLEGINLGEANNWRIQDNHIFIEEHLLNLPHQGTRGIGMNHSSLNQIYDNTVTDNSTDPSSGTWGIYAGNSPANNFCFNTTAATNFGIGFKGTCDNTTLRRLITDDNNLSLWCFPGTVISLQPDLLEFPLDNHSNEFHVGSLARHSGNDAEVNNSEFQVKTDVPVDHPNFIQLPGIPGGYDPMNPKWFKVSGNLTNTCSPPGAYPPPPGGDLPSRDAYLSETDEYFASGGFLGSPYGDALNWEGRLRLFKRMQKYPNFAGQSTIVDAFYANSANSAVGRYALADGAIAGINIVPAQWVSVIQSAKADIQNAISAAESQLAALAYASTGEDSTTIFRAAEQTRLTGLPAYETLMQYLHLADSLRSTRAQTAWAINEALPANGILQSNRKTVNRVYLETIGQGISLLTPAQFAAISPIAWQCQMEGGSAVNKARQLYLLHEKGSFDDILLCGLGSEERGQRLATAAPEGITLQPNPASGQVLIFLTHSDVADDLQVKITDLNGIIVLMDKIPAGAASLTLDSTKLPAGVYLCSVSGGSKPFAPLKFVVQH